MQYNFIGSPYMRALIRKYEYERDQAIANLHTYFDNATGVGEHGDIVGTMDEWVSQLCEAEDKLKALIGHFAVQQTQTETPPAE